MIFNIVVVSLIVLCAIVSMLDKFIFKGKYGLFTKFEEGVNSMGGIALAIIGIIVLVPIIAKGIQPAFTFLFSWLGADSAMGVAMILACDMGGYQLAMEVAATEQLGTFAGLVYGSMMGATIVFSIPVGLGIIKKEKTVTAFSKGILYGIIAIPFGTFVGGLIMNIEIITLLKNMVPPIIISAILSILLIFLPKVVTKVFVYFAKFITIVAYIGLAIGLARDFILSNLDTAGYIILSEVPFFNELNSIYDGIDVAGAVALTLAGALPFVLILNKALRKPLTKLSEKVHMSNESITGLLLSSANNIAMFSLLDNMKEKEVVINVAYSVGAAFIIGDHLAFVAANDASMIGTVMISKFVAGVLGVLFAILFMKISDKFLKNKSVEQSEKNQINGENYKNEQE